MRVVAYILRSEDIQISSQRCKEVPKANPTTILNVLLSSLTTLDKIFDRYYVSALWFQYIHKCMCVNMFCERYSILGSFNLYVATLINKIVVSFTKRVC